MFAPFALSIFNSLDLLVGAVGVEPTVRLSPARLKAGCLRPLGNTPVMAWCWRAPAAILSASLRQRPFSSLHFVAHHLLSSLLCLFGPCRFVGGGSGIRTHGQRIKSPLLSPLSYAPLFWAAGSAGLELVLSRREPASVFAPEHSFGF